MVNIQSGEALYKMDPIGHWALGFILGTLIILPFIRERCVFDYSAQKWVAVKWQEIQKETDKWVVTKNKKSDDAEIITYELHPITRSRFTFYHFIFASLCGFIALIPDIGQLWGDAHTDHQWWSDIFFFHRFFDRQYLGTPNPISFETLLIGTAIGIWIMAMIYSWYVQYDKKPVSFEFLVPPPYYLHEKSRYR